jgi:dTMP kinase
MQHIPRRASCGKRDESQIQMSQGLAIAVAGIDGSGKTTQCRLLCEALAARGLTVREKKVRFRAFAAMHELARRNWGDPYSYVQLIPAVYREMVVACELWDYHRSEIAPALARGEFVVWDRSPLCYRVYARAFGVEDPWPFAISEMVPEPALTVLLDLPLQTAVSRIVARESEPLRTDEPPELLARCIELYRAAAQTCGDIVPVDATLDRGQVAECILAAADQRFGDALGARVGLNATARAPGTYRRDR